MKKTHRQTYCYNSKIGHLFVPNINARVMNENGGYYVKTNSIGFRSDCEFREKKGSKPRILFFGDSNTASDGVSNNERFSELVGNYFNAEVYNYGLSGSGTDQQFLIYKEYAQKVEADLIILGILVENIERNKVGYRQVINYFTQKHELMPKPYYKFHDGELKLYNSPVPRFGLNSPKIDPNMVQWEVPKGREFVYGLLQRLRNCKPLMPFRNKFGALLKKLRSLLITMVYQPFPDYGDPKSEGYVITKEILKRFIKSASPIPVLIMPIPTFHYYADGAKPLFKDFFNSLKDTDNNVHVIDLTSYLKSLDSTQRQLLCFRGDKSHFSQYGQRKISEYLIKQINKYELLPFTYPIYNKRLLNKQTIKPIYILGISAFYHDSAATLIKNGEIIAAAQEERFTRIKNDRRFPLSSINFCLEKGNIQQSDLSAIVYYDNTSLTFERILWTFAKTAPESRNIWTNTLPSWVQYKLFVPQLIRKKLNYDGKILQDLHHRSHCAAAFYPSPFEKAAILTVDGVGEWATASIALGEGNKVTMIKEMVFPNSLGLLYSAFTQFTGFKVNSGEYKMMGLAPYGKPRYVNTILEKLINLKEDGSIDINQDYFSYLYGSTMTNQKFADLFDGPARKPESRITQREMDIACSIQKVTEKVILRMAHYIKELTGAENLCMAGGVALNCVANGQLLRENIFKDIWIQPAAGDAGSSLGCALDAYYMYFKKHRKISTQRKSIQKGSYWGPEWNKDEIQSFLDTEQIKYHDLEVNNRAKIIANFLNQGKIVGHFSGRTEFGPRALGARSILGDARSQEMQTIINLKIKYRESFRPFAPTVLAEKVNDYFESNKISPYMLFVSPVREARRLAFNRGNNEDMLEIVKQPRSDVPAITHIDYSARVQTIDRDDHIKYYDVIKVFEERTGYAIIVNTSFNIRGEPIVNSPWDAYRCFMNTEMDVLVLENCLLLKEEQPQINREESYKEHTKQKKSITNSKSLQKKLLRLYKSKFIIISKKYVQNTTEKSHKSSSWSDCLNQNDIPKIFDVATELDKENPDPIEMSKEIIKYWTNTSFGEILEPIVTDLILLGKQHPSEEDIDAVVSNEIYEMF